MIEDNDNYFMIKRKTDGSKSRIKFFSWKQWIFRNGPERYEKLTALLGSAKSILRSPMALIIVIRLCIVLLYTTGVYCSHSSLL